MSVMLIWIDAWHLAQLTALSDSSDKEIAAIAEKSAKEVTYHLERSSDTVIGLGDGTEESHRRMQAAAAARRAAPRGPATQGHAD